MHRTICLFLYKNKQYNRNFCNDTYTASLFKDQHLLYASIALTTIFCLLCVPKSQGHLSPPRGMRDDYFDRSHHRKPVLPGQCCPAEPVQGARPGEALSGGDVIDPGQGFGRVRDQSLGARSNARQRSRPSSSRRVSATLGTRLSPGMTQPLPVFCFDLGRGGVRSVCACVR